MPNNYPFAPPKLFKKTNTGAIQEWSICVKPLSAPVTDYASGKPTGVFHYGQIIVTHGQVDGAKQTTYDEVTEGKNQGKKNETSALGQAIAEATSKWEKQKKKGYVESIEDAEAGEVDGGVIEGGVLPMLAKPYKDHADKIKLPCYAQPKLDGMRCIAVIKNGKVSLWTRTRKAITSVPHIVKGLEERFVGKTITLDGELYNHDFHNDFNAIMKLARPSKPVPGHEKLQYHVYDIINNDTQDNRALQLTALPLGGPMSPLVYVPTHLMNSEDELTAFFEICRKEGYEGIIVRNREAKYEVGKRSYNLQKVKDFEDDEFEITGVKEGRGAMAGRAIFECKTKDGQEFDCKMDGPLDELVKYLHDEKLWKGKKLTVRFQNYTPDGKPRCCVGKGVRDYE